MQSQGLHRFFCPRLTDARYFELYFLKGGNKKDCFVKCFHLEISMIASNFHVRNPESAGNCGSEDADYVEHFL